MRVTVGICTFNRAPLLAQVLASLERLVPVAGVDWELLVVNNRSTDDTDEVIARHAERLPLRRLYEDTPGKSHALNRAVGEAQGDYIVWTDDDARVDPGWLEAYVRAFRRWPLAALFGGPVRPWFEGKPPAWLERAWPHVASAYATRELGQEPIRFDQKQIPYGVNMAVRTAEQRRFLYPTQLGPRPDSPLRGEDAMMARELLASGAEGWWVPDAVVHHFVPAARQTIAFLRDYYRGQGEYYLRTEPQAEGARWFGRPRWIWREAVEFELRYRLGRLFRAPERWIDDLIHASMAQGRLFGRRHD